MAIQIFFLIVALITLVSAVMVVAVRRMMHAALWLILSLFGVALLFAMLDSSFFAVVQLIVYIGAIAILVIFAVMLTRRVMDDQGIQTNRNWWVALVAVAIVFAGISFAMISWSRLQVGPGQAPADSLLSDFGMALVDPLRFSIPFEVASVLLVAALVGAIFVAVERKGGKG
jgi:NADH-quinone oxidoreductase subunit J